MENSVHFDPLVKLGQAVDMPPEEEHLLTDTVLIGYSDWPRSRGMRSL